MRGFCPIASSGVQPVTRVNAEFTQIMVPDRSVTKTTFPAASRAAWASVLESLFWAGFGVRLGLMYSSLPDSGGRLPGHPHRERGRAWCPLRGCNPIPVSLTFGSPTDRFSPFVS